MPKTDPEKDPKRIIPDILALYELKDDRSVAIAATSILDYWLGRAIICRLVNLTKTEKENLLDSGGNGVIATLSRKIALGHALGLYGKDVRGDLKLLNGIRNNFAHSDEHIGFDSNEVVASCGKLSAPGYLAKANMTAEPSDPKDRFLDSIHHFIAGLHIVSTGVPKRPTNEHNFLF